MSNATVGAAGLGATLFGGITGAMGASQLGAAQQQMYTYQSGLATINQQISLQNADYARDQGEQQALNSGLGAAQTKGQIVAAQASSGLDVNSGSTARVQASEAQVTGLNLQTIRSNAAKSAYDFDVQATQYGNQATLDTLAGKNASAAASINVESSILGTVSSVSSKWLQGSQVNLFGGAGGST